MSADSSAMMLIRNLISLNDRNLENCLILISWSKVRLICRDFGIKKAARAAPVRENGVPTERVGKCPKQGGIQKPSRGCRMLPHHDRPSMVMYL